MKKDAWIGRRVSSMPTVRELTSEDYKSANDIYHSAFEVSEPLSKLWRKRNRRLSRGVYSKEGDLLGFSIAVGQYICYIAVHETFQGTGVGTVLLKNLLQTCLKDRISITLKPLDDVVLWYCRHGFYDTLQNNLVFHSYNTRRQGNFYPRILGNRTGRS